MDYQEKFDASTHWEECSMCHAKRSTQAHSFAYETAAEQHTKYCTECGYKADPEAHTSNTWLTDASNQNHYKVCSVCKATFAQGAHASDTWKTDGTSHWKECDTCGKEFAKAEHDLGDWQTNDKQHWKVCGTCGETIGKEAHSATTWVNTDSSRHYQVCEDCGEEFNSAAHTYGPYISDGESGHHRECSCGYATPTEPHQFVTEEWQHDEFSHWHKCADCDATIDRASHDYGDDDVCDTCKYKFDGNYTLGLEYTWISNEGAFYVSGLGTVPESTDIVIPSKYADEKSNFEIKDVTGITGTAFSGKKIPSITIPKSVKTIGSEAFTNCTALTDVYYQGDLADWCLINFANGAANPIATANALHIGSATIGGQLVLGSDVKQVANFAFYQYEAITSVSMTGSTDVIGKYAFWQCTGLTSVSLGSGVTTVDSYAFYGCSQLRSVDFGNNTLYINDNAFNNCTSLAAVSFGSGLQTIGDNAFNACISLTSVTIPAKVNSIGQYAFGGCNALSSVVFEKTAGWGRCSTPTSPEINLDAAVLADSAAAANMLVSEYSNYYWKNN